AISGVINPVLTRPIMADRGFASMDTARRLMRTASTAVVALPPKGSSTTSPGTDSRAIKCAGICGINFAGYGCRSWVKYLVSSSVNDQSCAANDFQTSAGSARVLGSLGDGMSTRLVR